MDNLRRLALIAETGMTVDEGGRISVSGVQLAQFQQREAHCRLPFTSQDDRELVAWVARAEEEGVPVTGFEVFKDLERVCPRHTYQSWHARWSKKLRGRAASEPTPDTAHPDAGGDQREVLQVTTPDIQREPDLRRDEHVLTWIEGVEDLPADEAAVENADLFRPLAYHAPAGRVTEAHLKGESEKTLRQVLGVKDRRELLDWLMQPWVLEAYAEYAEADLKPRLARAKGLAEAMQAPEHHSTIKYLVNRAAASLRTPQSQYRLAVPCKDHWTSDDHYVRFIVRIVAAGRRPNRWWARYAGPDDLEQLCVIACRLVLWLRSHYRFTTATNANAQWQRANGSRWQSLLKEAVERHVSTSRSSGGNVATSFQDQTFSSNDNSSKINCIANDVNDSNHDQNSSNDSDDIQNDFDGSTPDVDNIINNNINDNINNNIDDNININHDIDDNINNVNNDNIDSDIGDQLRPARYTASLSVLDLTSQPAVSSDIMDTQIDVASDGDGHSFYSARSAFSPDRDAGNVETWDPVDHVNGRSAGEDLIPQIPPVPFYKVRTSKQMPGQVKALAWLTADARARFQSQQRILLAAWGVTSQYSGGCVLVPSAWAASNPADLMRSFTVDQCPEPESARLRFAMGEHIVTWVRAASWFAEARWPRTGVEFDNFLGYGPFEPMEGSHLCHHGDCIVPLHSEYEGSSINASRNHCAQFAQDLRLYGMPIPKHCTRHGPPCLLQRAALTTYEVFLIQFSVLRRAKGLPATTAPAKPRDHPYPTFEHQSPLSFEGDTGPNDLTGLIDAASPVPETDLHSPVLCCRLCSKTRSYRSITGYWAHVRDHHRLVSAEIRLGEIRHSAAIWREHLEFQKAHRKPVSLTDPTWMKLEQVRSSSFTWEVVRGWKLRYGQKQHDEN